MRGDWCQARLGSRSTFPFGFSRAAVVPFVGLPKSLWAREQST